VPVVVALLMLTLAGCGGPTPTATHGPTPQPQVTATLGIYSGRPDPSWALTDAEASLVIEAISSLPVRVGEPPPGGLGYHGFTLVIRRPGLADETVVAFQGTIAPPGVGSREYRVDEGRTVERLVLDAGRAHLTPAEIAAVIADMATP
jgi:hypothetical protein